MVSLLVIKHAESMLRIDNEMISFNVDSIKMLLHELGITKCSLSLFIGPFPKD